ncbi:MAG: betaine-aldehyde dehydrogenase [Pseudonocardiales bacterium]|nr:betaine-aldehyde dehydrogenase [Pseudonocardiales bacterium]
MPSLFIDGTWTNGHAARRDDVINPFDQSVVQAVDLADAEDVNAAVAAAKAAFAGEWFRTPASERKALLLRVADLLTRDKDEIARIETLDTGKTLVESKLDIDDVTAVFRYYAGMADQDPGRIIDTGMANVLSRVVYEPVGVCALITPWNYPLLQLSWKVAPALAAGNTVVIKPSEVTPLSSIKLVQLLEEAGAPRGVVNLVLGDGPNVGAPLVSHPDVELVSFTGGLSTGQSIIRASADTVKKVAVELGGKNPNIVFADADLETAIDYALTAVFLHSGQVCSAGARLIVADSLHDEFVAEVGRRAERIRLGNGLDPKSESGPLVSAAHRAKIEAYVASAQQEGARLVAGGHRPDDPALDKGFFYRPTLFADCHRGMKVIREETFGPILTVERFSDEAEAIELGNDTDYGLAGAVWTSDMGTAQRVSAALRHGTVWINDYHPYVPQAEWGGFKRSGNGRELGPTGLAEYREAKHIWHNTAPAPLRWFKG